MRHCLPHIAIVPSLASVVVARSPVARAGGPADLSGLDAAYPRLDALYQDLHRHPELSRHEDKTAAKLAARLRELGFEVTEHVGGLGVVSVLKNGPGPAVLVRTDMDALPIKEQTGLPYASTVTAKNAASETVPVMHACGHDAHMTSWAGAATLVAAMKGRWQGTLVMVGQPAEEGGSRGAGRTRQGDRRRDHRPGAAHRRVRARPRARDPHRRRGAHPVRARAPGSTTGGALTLHRARRPCGGARPAPVPRGVTVTATA